MFFVADEGTSFLYEQSDGLLVKLLIIQRRYVKRHQRTYVEFQQANDTLLINFYTF